MTTRSVVIGQGSFSNVYKLVNSDGTFAAKVPKKGMEEALLKECDMLKYLETKVDFATANIIKMFGMSNGEFAGIQSDYLKLEYHEMTLDKYVKNQGGNLSLKKTAEITKELAKALLFLSDVCVIHTDIKPKNILVSGDRVVLADFGSAMLTDEAKANSYIQTRFYRSPEVALKAALTSAADVWSLAVTVTEIYAKNIFAADSGIQLVTYHQLQLSRCYPEDLIARFMAIAPRVCSESIEYVAREMNSGRIETLDDIVKNKVERPIRSDSAIQKNGLLDLLNKMFDFSADSRIKPEKILEHPFLSIKEAESNGLGNVWAALYTS